ncbi:hypothetical protein PENARI_c001G04604 [Penicillium arizonense]|uniref:Cyanovirin-N domain-containing protein n=1 Tax=Penicillium arizonense TaxID=1835702 RepID=A0A1F5LYH7_PENAI|nr:hypothetical protein PENARI_c001G04604 [Penicillium arizonense]OGE58096.1 hypothetical protein PENARI_c001G04604 [Penicillium arizonense]
MSFFQSCENVRIEINDGSIFLHCDAQDVDGNLHPATLRLDDFIGNEDGWFMWDGVNAGQSAQSIELDGSMLTAELPMRDGGYRERQGIDLNDRISNENGHLELHWLASSGQYYVCKQLL